MSVKQSRGHSEAQPPHVLTLSPGPALGESEWQAERPIDIVLREITRDTAALNAKLISATELLAEMGEWPALVRLLVGVGGYQIAEIADALGVMHHTVECWYNDETEPQRDQIPVYAERLIAYMRPTRRFDLRIASADMVDESVRIDPVPPPPRASLATTYSHRFQRKKK